MGMQFDRSPRPDDLDCCGLSRVAGQGFPARRFSGSDAEVAGWDGGYLADLLVAYSLHQIPLRWWDDGALLVGISTKRRCMCSIIRGVLQTQLSHQTKKYDLKSKHCGAQSDLGTTRAKVVEALTEVRRAKIDGPALIFDDQLCELHSSNTDASTSASSRSMPNVLGKGSDF